MQTADIQSLFLKHKETALYHRYITNNHIQPLLKKLDGNFSVDVIGNSVQNEPIYGVKIGQGPKRILMWSQMHGNESTTTKAIFDLFNTFSSDRNEVKEILSTCSIYIIPILNPDGAKAYTRINANEIDLNRDAQERTQPESRILRTIFDSFKPDFCYNLHGQRTIFSVDNTNLPATVSFLAPAQDKACTVTPNRKIAMEVIGVMNNALQKLIPNQIGVYDDAFNINCVGDAFQSENAPTILFEAGHFKADYGRDKTREFIYISLLSSLSYISKNDVDGSKYEPYFIIPENQKYFYDIIIRNAKFGNSLLDIALLYQERLNNECIGFVPKVERIEKLDTFYGHKEFDASGFEVLNEALKPISIGDENDYVLINNEKTTLLVK
jgi:hypothetical protein